MAKKQINVGGVLIGGGAPVTVQSMTNTKTEDPDATVAQINALRRRGVTSCASPCRIMTRQRPSQG